MAVDRILLDGRSIDASISKQIPTETGFVVTNGFVVIHSPVDFKHDTNNDIQLGERLQNLFIQTFETNHDDIYSITSPFQLRKVAISLRSQCKLFQTTNKYRQSFITFIGDNSNNEKACGTFNLQHLLCAFDCVGRKAVGTLYKNPSMFNGDTFMYICPEDDKYNLISEVNAIILQSHCQIGV